MCRKSLAGVLFLVAVAAPVTAQDSPTNQSGLPTDTVAAIMATLDQAWDDHDAELFGSLFAPEGEILEVPTGKTFVGPAGAADYVHYTYVGAPESTIEITQVIRDGNKVATEWVWEGMHTGDWEGLPATGRPFRIEGVNILEVTDGLITRYVDYWDMYTALQQLGVLPSGSEPPSE